MVKKRISEWKGGDTGVFSDGKHFKLSKVSAPTKHEPGHNSSTSRSERMVGAQDVVDVKVVWEDSFGIEIVEITKRGRNINEILEMKNNFFDIRSET